MEWRKHHIHNHISIQKAADVQKAKSKKSIYISFAKKKIVILLKKMLLL
jgi:hypothetical protein